MKNIFLFSIALIVIIAFYFIVSMFTKYEDDITEDEYQVTFNFIHKVGDETMEFDTIRYFNEFGNKYSVATLKYFISDITFHKPDGETFIFDEEHYVDAVDKTTLSFIPTSKVPSGMYSHVSFIFGLDTTKNVTGRYPNPPENKMEWPVVMGGGYHYLKLEGKFDSSGLIKSFQAHSGQLNGAPNFIVITDSVSSFVVGGNDVVIQIVMDINKMWINPNTLDLNDISSIMGNSTIQQQLKENGADIFSVVTTY